MVIREVCLRCQSPKSKKNGHLHNGTQHHQCQDGSRQGVDGVAPNLVLDLTFRTPLRRRSMYFPRGIFRTPSTPQQWYVVVT